MVKIEFVKEKNAPYGFSVEPVDKSNYEKTTYETHLDTDYVRMKLWMDNMCVCYLFDEHKNHVSWKQRESEIGSEEKMEATFQEYSVVRVREVSFIEDSYYDDGVEYFSDTLYHKGRYQYSKRYYAVVPMSTLYEEAMAHEISNRERNKDRDEAKIKYLNPKTSKEDRLKILNDEVGFLVGVYAYHPMLRDSNGLENLPNYGEYEKRYYSRVENKEDYYIEYLRAYYRALRESCIDDIEGEREVEAIEREVEAIRAKCEEANFLTAFERWHLRQ